MIKRIDLFLPIRSRYEALHFFTRSLHEALCRTGVDARLLDVENREGKSFIDQILSSPPDCTFCFNGLLPDEDGNFLCDTLKIPHIGFLVDSPHYFLSFIRSKYNILTLVDRFGCQFFQNLNFKNVLFLPHGVDRNLIQQSPSSDSDRPYDVLMLASFNDFEGIEGNWMAKYDKPFVHALMEAVENVFANVEIPYAQALAQAIDHYSRKVGGIDVRKFNFTDILTDLENYIRGKDRFELLKSIKEAEVHLIGVDSHKWKSLLKNPSNITAYDPISYSQAINFMQKSKIVLNSSPFFKNGSHERVFTGIAAGALVFSSYSLYFNEFFTDGVSIGYYYPSHWDEVNDAINDYLKDSEKRYSIISRGQQIVQNCHTWDHRAESLIREAEPILKKMKNYDF